LLASFIASKTVELKVLPPSLVKWKAAFITRFTPYLLYTLMVS
jgi:hypothetical protein